jgi:HlyD family secretion protein
MSGQRRIAIIAALAVVAVAVAAVMLWSGDDEGAVLASGTVEATDADLGFQLPGRIDSIAVVEGDGVTPGAALAWLDRRDLEAQLRAAEAQRAAAGARLTELERGFRSEEIAQARAALRAAEQRAEDARRDFERTRRLVEGGALSQQQLDNHRTALTLAESEAEAARERLQLLETGPRAEQIAAQRSLVRQAEAQAAQVRAALDNATIRAPFAGVVTIRHREPGETVAPGSPVLTVMNPDDRWIRIYVPERQVGRLALGMPAEIRADAYPDRAYGGDVVFIASEAEFTPRNVQTAAERVKLVYRVKVRVTGDPDFDLKPGLPADVRLELAGR